ncbi:MAG: sigma-70 family RNA polymerase sigma factor [Chloroflexi bacterium]|nr:MAG: sigma-70 family RNA polymerase sigma factor [Chloroflexota bacterium]
MPEAENYALPEATNDTWRAWLMTGARRAPVDPRRMRGANKGLKKILIEGMTPADDQPHRWKDFSGAMVRHAVDEAMRTLPAEDKHVVKLAYFGGYSNREIARHVGLTEVTVQRRLRRALGAISEFIQHGHALRRRALYALTVWLSGHGGRGRGHHRLAACAPAGRRPARRPAVAINVELPRHAVGPDAFADRSVRGSGRQGSRAAGDSAAGPELAGAGAAAAGQGRAAAAADQGRAAALAGVARVDHDAA